MSSCCMVQDITTQFRLFSSPSTSLFILIQGFNKGDNPGDSWNDQIFYVPLLCSNDRFPLAGTHFRTGDSSVVYIFYGLWALSSTEVRLGVIVFPLCEVSGGAKIERFNKNFLLNLAMPLWASVEETGLWEWAAKTTSVARGTYDICPCLMWRVKAETCIFYWLVFPWIGRNNFNLLLFA